MREINQKRVDSETALSSIRESNDLEQRKLHQLNLQLTQKLKVSCIDKDILMCICLLYLLLHLFIYFINVLIFHYKVKYL